jgi:hypothetical protein
MNANDTIAAIYQEAYRRAYGYYPENDDIAAHEAKDAAGRAAELTWLRIEFTGPSPDTPEYFAQLAEEQAERDAELDFVQEGV